MRILASCSMISGVQIPALEFATIAVSLILVGASFPLDDHPY
jgi:hypothetical protein